MSSSADARSSNIQQTASHRLYNEADNRFALREKQRQRFEQEELSKYPIQMTCSFPRHSFKPTINAFSQKKYIDNSNYRPIQQRVGELIRKKKEKLHHLWKENQSSNPDLTFKPQINDTSKEPVVGKEKRKLPVVERLETYLKDNLGKLWSLLTIL